MGFTQNSSTFAFPVVETLKNNQSNKGNKSYFEHEYDVALIFLSLAIIAANSLVIVLFVGKYQLRTKANTLLLSLAVSDLLMGSFGIPFYIACNVLYTKPICASATVIYRFIANSTILHILSITVERYISVIHPLKYFSIVTRSRVMKVIFSIWAGSLFAASVQLSWINFQRHGYDSFEIKCNLIYNAVSTLVCFALPVISMSFIYCRVYFAVRHQILEAKKHRVFDQKRIRGPLLVTAELRAIVIFALMLGIFISFWVSWYIIALRLYISSYFHENFAVDIVTLDVLTFLRLSTSLVNPVLYTFLKQDFRKALVSTIPCNLRRRTPNDNHGLEMITLKTSSSTVVESNNPCHVGSSKSLRMRQEKH